MSPSNKFFHKIRFFLWLIAAYLKKHALFLIFGLVIGIIVGIKMIDFFPIIFSTGQEERIGIIGNYTQNSLPLEIQSLISFGLTTHDQNWKVIPKSIQSMEVKNSGKTYVFHLKKNLFWHDKKQFTAYDINYTFKDVKTRVENESTICFELTEAFSPFPSLVTQPLFKKGLIGLGEYKVTRIETEGKFISKLVLEKPKQKIIFKFYPKEEDAIIGFKLGEINTIKEVNNIGVLKSWKNAKIIPNNQESRYIALFLNVRTGLLQEKPFRQALSYAIEDNLIKERKILGPISPNSWAYNPNVKTYDYNLDSAQKLFSKSVSATESSAIRLRLTVLRPYGKYSEAIVNSWRKLGIETKTEIVSLPPANFEVLLAAQEIPKDPDQYFMWHSTSKLNITGYNNPRIDKLLEDGRKTIDQKERKEKYYDFQRFLVEDSPVIFLYFPTTYTVTRI